jgi:hypothetical protein
MMGGYVPLQVRIQVQSAVGPLVSWFPTVGSSGAKPFSYSQPIFGGKDQQAIFHLLLC